jgi:hypothetical protein
MDAIAQNRDPATLGSAACNRRQRCDLASVPTSDDRAWRDRSAAEVCDRFHAEGQGAARQHQGRLRASLTTPAARSLAAASSSRSAARSRTRSAAAAGSSTRASIRVRLAVAAARSSAFWGSEWATEWATWGLVRWISEPLASRSDCFCRVPEVRPSRLLSVNRRVAGSSPAAGAGAPAGPRIRLLGASDVRSAWRPCEWRRVLQPEQRIRWRIQKLLCVRLTVVDSVSSQAGSDRTRERPDGRESSPPRSTSASERDSLPPRVSTLPTSMNCSIELLAIVLFSHHLAPPSWYVRSISSLMSSSMSRPCGFRWWDMCRRPW